MNDGSSIVIFKNENTFYCFMHDRSGVIILFGSITKKYILSYDGIPHQPSAE